MSVLIMIASAVAIIALVKFGLLRAIDNIANAGKWSAKTRGQVTGYATSIPELVCLVSAGLAGVWEAGLWNIASSNIINVSLMLIAITFYRQVGDLFNIRFLDEIGFATLAVAVPIVLMSWGMDTKWYVVPILIGFFCMYQLIDKTVNRPGSIDSSVDDDAVGSLPFGLILGLSALIAIGIVGVFLGNATADVVEQLGIRPAIAGWILGVVTSIPEMVTFFAVYAAAHREKRSQSLNDTQEALDNLTGSNMANAGIIYPLGLLAYLLVTSFLGG